MATGVQDRATTQCLRLSATSPRGHRGSRVGPALVRRRDCNYHFTLGANLGGSSVFVAIYGARGGIIGAGFVASEQLVLTCAHIVEQAGRKPDEDISVRFQANDKIQVAHILSECWRSPDTDDIAVLRLQDKLPVDVKPVVLGKADGSDKHPFRSLGYPVVGDYVGIAASGKIEAVVQKADGRRMLQLTSSQLMQGHSGAPVLDESSWQAVGMVSEVYGPSQDSKNRDTAFATPTERLVQVCPELIVRLRITGQARLARNIGHIHSLKLQYL